MEEIRQALGEEKLNYLGYSYGTRLGALYLQTYPENSGAFILDASLPPESSIQQLAADTLAQLQTNLETLFSDCARIDTTCNPEELVTSAESRIDALIAENANKEFELFFGVLIFSAQDLNIGELVLGPLVIYLQNRDFASFEESLGAAFNDDNDDDNDDNSAIVAAVLCADDATRPDISTVINDLAELNKVSNIFAEEFIGDLTATCIGWPEALSPLQPIATSMAPQAIIIGGATDSVTPIQWSRDMATAIGGYFIESAHEGHTTVFNRGNTCIDSAVTDFLRNGNLPAITACPAP